MKRLVDSLEFSNYLINVYFNKYYLYENNF